MRREDERRERMKGQDRGEKKRKENGGEAQRDHSIFKLKYKQMNAFLSCFLQRSILRHTTASTQPHPTPVVCHFIHLCSFSCFSLASSHVGLP